MGNNSVNEPLIRPDRPLSHNERQNRVLMLGGVMWAAGFVVNGVAQFATDNGSTHQALLGVLLPVEALLQTIGTMVVAAADADLDLFAKKHPRFVVAFSLVWIVLYEGLSALCPPILSTNQVFWANALPFAYLLLRCDPVLQMRDQSYPRFSDLLVYSLALDLGSFGAFYFLYTNTIIGAVDPLRTWPNNIVSTLYVLGGALVFGVYWHFRGTHSRRLAL